MRVELDSKGVLIFFGLFTSESGYVGFGHATPALENMEGTLMSDAWGATAPRHKRVALARFILEKFDAAELSEDFAEDVLKKIHAHKKWVLAETTIREWINSRLVN